MKDITLHVFQRRLKKIGIDIELVGNAPWIYISKINGKTIHKDDYFLGNHGFTVAFYPIALGIPIEFTDIGRIFNLIRKYKDGKDNLRSY